MPIILGAVLCCCIIVPVSATINASVQYDLAANSSFTDLSAGAHATTAHGNAAINTTTYKFGGGSSYFDGTSGTYASIAASSAFNPGSSTSVSYSFWYYPVSHVSAAAPFLISSDGLDKNSIGFRYHNTNLAFLVGDGSTYKSIDTAANPSTGNWHYVVGIIDRGSQTIKFYVDGVSQGTPVSISGFTPLDVSAVSPAIGKYPYSTPAYLNGYVDDLIITDTVIDPTIIPDREFNANPAASFSANVTAGSSPLAVQFTNTSVGNIAATTYNWSYTNSSSTGGNGTQIFWSTSASPTQTFGFGNWSINETITNPFGVSTALSWVNVSGTPPIAGFTYSPSSGPTPLTVSFTDTSITNITAWNWTFGAANYSSLQNPSYEFVGAGNYSVTLQVTNASGTNSTTKYVLVNSLTDPNLNSTLEYAVTATPQINNQTPITGTIKLSEVNTNTTWVKINATWDPKYFGVSDIRVNTSEISGASLASSEIHNGYFIANVSKSAGMEFAAPGKSLIDFNITMTKYAAPGTAAAFNFTSANSQYYDIGNLSAWNFNHFSGMTTHTGVWGPITASFTGTPTLVSIGSPVAFTDASTGYPDAWSWNFGDGETSTAQNPSHAYSTAGLYSVTETAYMAENATVTNTTTRTDYINVSSSTTPVAAFTGSPTTVTLGTAVSFTDQSTGSPTSWTWNFGDSSGSANQNPTHTYASVGVYNVTLTAANWIGNSTLTKTNYITVQALVVPVANFTSNASSGQIPLAVQFNDTSANVPTSWSWVFGDGGTSTLQNPEHTFSTAGNWTANLTATNAAGSNTTTRYILATSPSGFNRQDLYLSPEYTLVLTIKDTDGNVIPVVTVSDSDGNVANTTNGVYIHTYPYEAVAIYLSSDGYQSRSITYVMNRDRVETVQMTAGTTQSQNTNIIYTQHQVRLRVLDLWANPLKGVTITASYVNSTLPGNNATFLEQAFGVSASVAETMMDSGVAMQGITATDGSQVFTMFPSLTYSLSMVNSTAGVSCQKSLAPEDSDYILYCPTSSQSLGYNTTATQLANSYVWLTEPNKSYVTVNYQYQDPLGLTTDLFMNLTCKDNGTVFWSHDYGNPGTSLIEFNYTIPNVRGMTIQYGMYPVRSG